MARREEISAAKGALIAVGILLAVVAPLLCVVGFLPVGLFMLFYLAAIAVYWCWLIDQLWSRLTRTQKIRYAVWDFAAAPLLAVVVSVALFEEAATPLASRIYTRILAVEVAGICISLIYLLIYKNNRKMRKKIVAGNWKMNTLPAEGVALAKNIVANRKEVSSDVKFIVCPPFTHLSLVADALKGSDVALGAQNCAAEAKGAYTGEIAADMIAALGCKYVILGHSERRQYYGETSATLNKKMTMAYANNLIPIYCVGENLTEREAGKHFDVVKAQIEEVVFNLTPEQFKNLVIAYEPVWAIGTGKTATADQAQEIHAYIRKVLASKFGAAAEDTAILYGGSCKPSNAEEIFAKKDVDGGLIGGAALKAEDFLAIGKGFKK